MLDARMQEVYGAVFEWHDNEFRKLIPDTVASVDNILDGYEDEPVLCFGSGAELYRERIETVLGGNAQFVEESVGLPRSSRIAMMACERVSRGESDDIDLLEPVYLRKSEAERARERRAQEAR